MAIPKSKDTFESTAQARIQFCYYETSQRFGSWPVSELSKSVKHTLAVFFGNKNCLTTILVPNIPFKIMFLSGEILRNDKNILCGLASVHTRLYNVEN